MIQLKEINNIAHLAQLKIDSLELPNYQEDLNQIISLIEQMQKVNTENIEPLAHPFEINQRLRDDIVTETNQRDKLQQTAPLIEKGLFKVPKVIE